MRESAEDSLYKESIIELPEPGDEAKQMSPLMKTGGMGFLNNSSMIDVVKKSIAMQSGGDPQRKSPNG